MNKVSVKKKLVLIVSEYNENSRFDIRCFSEQFCKDFDVYVVDNYYQDDLMLVNEINYIKSNTSLANYHILTADYLIDDGSINRNQRFFVKQKRIAINFGIPFKHRLQDSNRDSLLDELRSPYAYDLMFSPSKKFTSESLRNSLLYKGDVLEVVRPSINDLLERNNSNEITSLKNKLGLPTDKKIVLYAPAFNSSGKTSVSLSRIKKLLGKDYIIISKLAFNCSPLESKHVYKDFTKQIDINAILLVSDIMISDYNTLMFDYAVLNRKLILLQNDKNVYVENSYGFRLEDFLSEKFIVKNEEELYTIISNEIDSVEVTKLSKYFYSKSSISDIVDICNQMAFDSTIRKMKEVIFVTNDLNCIGGLHSFVLNLAREFISKYNCKCYIIGYHHINRAGTDFVYFDPNDVLDIKMSFNHSKKEVIDILSNTDGYIIPCQFTSHLMLQEYFKEKNVVTMFHGNCQDVVDKTMYKWHLNYIESQTIGNYKKLAVLTKSNKEILVKKLKNEQVKKNVVYIENSMDFKNGKNLFADNRDFVSINRLDKEKNIFDLIKIFKNSNLDEKVRLFVYGDGNFREQFIEEIKKNNLEDRILYLGYCEDKAEMFKNKEGFISTSLSEGFPIVILEAIKFYVPSYVYDSYPAAKDMTDGVGKTVKTGDINQMVELLNNPPKFSIEAFKNKQKEFDNSTIVEKWYDLLLSLDSQSSIEYQETLVRKTKKTIKAIIISAKSFARKNVFPMVNSKLKRNLLNFKSKIQYYSKCLFLKKGPLVSIVIPYYYSSKTISATLKSLKKQSYKNIEIVIVNDGSDSYNPPQDKNIHYFVLEKNVGPGLTRDFGISKSRGKYIFFLDSDDEIARYGLSFLVDYAERKKLDLVSGRTRRYNVLTEDYSPWFARLYKKCYVNKRDQRHLLLLDTLTTNKLFNRVALVNSGLKFDIGLYEDKLLAHKVYNYYDKIGIINKDVYIWYIYGTNTSITTTLDYENTLERLDKINKILNTSTDIFIPTYLRNFIIHDFRIICENFSELNNSDATNIYKIMRDIMVKWKRYYVPESILKSENYECAEALSRDDYSRFIQITSQIHEIKKMGEEL